MTDPNQSELFPTFDDQFWKLHLGRLLENPAEAIVELVANGYDAGATRLRIEWPDTVGEQFSVSDNGHGMSGQHFRERWAKFNYNRRRHQGALVEFPAGRRPAGVGERRAFGHSGRGRHAAFCFDDEYEVKTWCNGETTRCKVIRLDEGDQPIRFEFLEAEPMTGNGTKVSAVIRNNLCRTESLVDAVGSKFLVDPSFQVFVNGDAIGLTDLENVTTETLSVPGVGPVQIHTLERDDPDRTTALRGITYWVNSRMVGYSSWQGLDESGRILDGRSREARQFSFVVQADAMAEIQAVKPEWSGFYASNEVNALQRVVHDYVTQRLNERLGQTYKERKITALRETSEALGGLTKMSRASLGQFVEKVVSTCPTISQGDLNRVASLFASMEETRTGHALLTQLAECSPDEIDQWSEILDKWSAHDAKLVLDELYRRLELIQSLQRVVNDLTADELHELHPLIDRGLWIFGPEYDSVEFFSNRELATVLREGFARDGVGRDEDGMRRRPDIVAMVPTDQHIVERANGSLAVYSRDGFGPDGEVSHLAQVLIVELKAPGVEVTRAEHSQALDYAGKLKDRGHLADSTVVHCFVIGGSVGRGTDKPLEQEPWLRIFAMDLGSILRRAQRRTFRLLERMEQFGVAREVDADAEMVYEEEVASGANLYENSDQMKPGE